MRLRWTIPAAQGLYKKIRKRGLTGQRKIKVEQTTIALPSPQRNGLPGG